MKFLLTGASGFLGRSLIKKLQISGHEVVVIGRTKPVTKTVNFYKADITDTLSLKEVAGEIGEIESVIHMAALVPKSKEEDEPEPMDLVNRQGTINLLEIFGPSIKNFVYASTAEVYGLPDTHEPITESTEPKPLSNYGTSKLAGEEVVITYGRQHDIPVAVLRFTVMYGSGDLINRALPNFIKKALAGENLEVYGGEELRDYVHVEDAAEALCLAATKKANGIFNIGTGVGVSIKAAAETIIKMINPSLRLDIQPRQKPASDIVLNAAKAKTILGFVPKYIFPNKLDEQIEWHRQQ